MRALIVNSGTVSVIHARVQGIVQSSCIQQQTANYAEVERQVALAGADLLIVVLSPDTAQGLAALQRARAATARVVLAVGPASDPKLIMKALNEGADRYLDEADLESSLGATLARFLNRPAGETPSGVLVAVLGTAGGSGASTLAVNVATVLARDHGKCGLIDLKPGRGDLAALLDLSPTFHLSDLCRYLDRLDQAMFEKALVRHATGMHLLSSSPSFAHVRDVTPQGVSQVLALARRSFAHVVTDQEDCFHDEQITALRQATVILLVSRLDFTSLRNARRMLDHFAAEGIERGRIRLVVNRHGQAGELPAEEVEDALGGKLANYIPDDPKSINGANNTGIPVVLKAPSARVSVALTQLARSIVEAGDDRRTHLPSGKRITRVGGRF